MRWKGRSGSSNIDDRRNQRISSPRQGGAGIIGFIPIIYRMFGFKGIIFAGLAGFAYFFFSGNLGVLTEQSAAQSGSTVQTTSDSPKEAEMVEFVSVILADTEQTWAQLFAKKGMTYKEPTLVLFRNVVRSACGTAQSASGPFYCPADQQVYIDLSFFDELAQRYGAPGDFAQAYVLAHEVGHHIQTISGISNKVMQKRQAASNVESNQLSVLQELQADCLAGVWAFQANKQRQLLEMGDIEEGLKAASAIGDDTLQKQAGGRVTPDSFTHGSSAQRVQWFKRGLEKGSIDSCDTFSDAGVKL